MDDKYTLEMTRDELHIIKCALDHELDRLDVLRNHAYDDIRRLDKLVCDMYECRTPLRYDGEHERSWIVAEMDRV